jgi:parvulin-like peptidyl-prolyl isomerase
MDQESLVSILKKSGKTDEWVMEHLATSGSWRPVVYTLGNEKLLGQVDQNLRSYINFRDQKKTENPELPDDLRRNFIKEEWLRPQLNDYFYKRKRDLDQCVYSMLRLTEIGLAEELYLRLKNKECSIAELAFKYSIGPEKYTKGTVGPMPLSKTTDQVRALSTNENVGKLNKPLVIQNTIAIIVVEHIIESTLTPETEEQLLEELLNIELQKVVNTIVEPS